MPSTRRIVTLIAIAVALITPAAVQAVQPRASLPDIEDEVMCTVCGTTLQMSESPQADRERALIRRLIASGDDKQQIKDALVAEYGPNVLALPSGGGFNISSWLVPAIGFALALLGLGVGVNRVRRRRRADAGSIPELSEDERRRLDAELSAFDR